MTTNDESDVHEVVMNSVMASRVVGVKSAIPKCAPRTEIRDATVSGELGGENSDTTTASKVKNPISVPLAELR
jgi:hypothetical protein